VFTGEFNAPGFKGSQSVKHTSALQSARFLGKSCRIGDTAPNRSVIAHTDVRWQAARNQDGLILAGKMSAVMFYVSGDVRRTTNNEHTWQTHP